MKRLATVVLVLALSSSAAAVAQESVHYTLGPEDVIQIQIPSRVDLSGRFVLDPDGNIRLPVLGEVEAQGLNTSELGERVREMYSILDPTISEVLVTVLETHSQRVSVVGEVRFPGPYSFRTIPDLWEILLRAGGSTAGADMTRVQVVRKQAVKGEDKTILVDLSAGYEGADREAMPEVRPGDTIIIPSLAPGSTGGEQVQVLGFVKSPGLYSVRTAGTVVEALSVSGGATNLADLRKVRLTRKGESGSVVYSLNLEGYLREGFPASDLPLKAGDTLYFPQRGSPFLTSLLGYAPLIGTTAAVLLAIAAIQNN